MLGSSEAPTLPPLVQTLQPQVAQPVTAHIGTGTQERLETDTTVQPAVDKETEKDSSGLVLPLARIKRIIKSEGDVKAVSSEASFAVARAAELLLEELARRANMQMQSQHRSTLQYKDVATVVHDWKALLFLSDIVPQPVPVLTLLEKYRQQHPELVHQQTNGTAVAPAVAASQQQAQQVAQQPAQQPAQQLAQQHTHQHAQPNPVQQRPAHSIFSQSQVQNAHAQNPLQGQQLAQLVQPRMQHFPVAEQVQHLLPPRLPMSTMVSQASTSQNPPLSQHQSLGQLQSLLSQQQLLSQQHALAQQQALAQQAKQHVLVPQTASQQQAAPQPSLGQHLLAQQQAMAQQQQQQHQQQQAMAQQQQQHAMSQKLQQQAMPQQQQQQQQALPQQQQQQQQAVSQQQQQQQQQQAVSQQQQLAAQHQTAGQLQPTAQQGQT